MPEIRSNGRRAGEVLRDAARGAHYEVIEGAGHISPLSHPLDVARIVSGHLNRMRESIQPTSPRSGGISPP